MLGRLPALEARRAQAKEGLAEAERELRKALGRRPEEVDRCDDVGWARAAVVFKEADQALFVARSLTSWDD